MLAHFRAATSWYTIDQDTELTPEYATQVLIDMSDPRSEYFGQLRHESAPPDHIFGRRMEVLTLAVLAQLHARGNFHRIAREWFYDDPPTTELGEAEAEFYAAAPREPCRHVDGAADAEISATRWRQLVADNSAGTRNPELSAAPSEWRKLGSGGLGRARGMDAVRNGPMDAGGAAARGPKSHSLDLEQAGGAGTAGRQAGGDPDAGA